MVIFNFDIYISFTYAIALKALIFSVASNLSKLNLETQSMFVLILDHRYIFMSCLKSSPLALNANSYSKGAQLYAASPPPKWGSN